MIQTFFAVTAGSTFKVNLVDFRNEQVSGNFPETLAEDAFVDAEIFFFKKSGGLIKKMAHTAGVENRLKKFDEKVFFDIFDVVVRDINGFHLVHPIQVRNLLGDFFNLKLCIAAGMGKIVRVIDSFFGRADAESYFNHLFDIILFTVDDDLVEDFHLVDIAFHNHSPLLAHHARYFFGSSPLTITHQI